jgi:hypothetical protein
MLANKLLTATGLRMSIVDRFIHFNICHFDPKASAGW